MKMKFLFKVHKSYRWVVAICDEEVFGRKLSDSDDDSQVSVTGGKKKLQRVLDVSGNFFRGEVMSREKVAEEIIRCNREDATFNFVGKNSVQIAKELGIVKDEGIIEIDNVPFALVLL